jgi:integrase
MAYRPYPRDLRAKKEPKMPNVLLTDLTVQRLTAPGVYMDTKLRAFGVRVGKNRKTWIVVPNQRRVRKVIGRYPEVSLAAARQSARLVLAEKSPFKELTVSKAVETFLALHKANTRPSTHYSAQRHLNGYIVPHLGSSVITDVKAHKVMEIVEAIKHPAEAAKTFHIAKQFWRWAAGRGHCPHILTNLGPPSHSPQRTRVLTDEELGRIWKACEEGDDTRLPATYCTIVKLLALTGQRRGEITAFQTPWLQNNIITIPKEVAKNGREHPFPIAALSATLLAKATKKRSPANGYIFLDATKLFCDWSRCKKLLDKISGVTGWTLHDLRRTYASNLAKLGVRIEVIERLLNHHSGTFRGVAGVYQRYDYMPEMREAVEKWERHLADLIQ